jgi:hypothetical protein
MGLSTKTLDASIVSQIVEDAFVRNPLLVLSCEAYLEGKILESILEGFSTLHGS